jgi:pimeloyl-ACP methyl ester carboxylesterase
MAILIDISSTFADAPNSLTASCHTDILILGLSFYTLAPFPSPSTALKCFTIVFIHGLGSSSSFYSPLVPYFVFIDQGHRCLTFDTHGSGSSPYAGSDNSIASIASDACALLISLSIIEDIVVVGHSMGGVASELAVNGTVNVPPRFKALVLIGPVNPNPEVAKQFEKKGFHRS